VFLDVETVPAIYSPTHAIQTASVRPGNVTEVNFGVSPLNSVSGVLQSVGPEGDVRPVAGARVSLLLAAGKEDVADSVTDERGRYFLGDIRPGHYFLRVDPKTLPEGTTADPNTLVEIHPATEPQELTLAPLRVHDARESGPAAASGFAESQ
jgi:hypothetical protein